MNPSTASRWAFAILIALPVLLVCGFVLNAPPEIVFYIGVIVSLVDLMLPIWLVAVSTMPPSGSLPITKRFRFTIRDLLSLTTFLFGFTVFMISAFKCAAAEESSRPNPLPAIAFRQFVWDQEAGLICMAISDLIWVRSALERPNK
jgi:hypothetical protein